MAKNFKRNKRLIGSSKGLKSVYPIDTSKTKASTSSDNPALTNYKHLLELAKWGNFQSKASTIQLNWMGYYSRLRELRNNFITNGIYDIIKNEIFSNSINNGIILSMDNKTLEKEANDLIQSEMVIGQVKSFLPDLLHYGSYTITPEFTKGVGLTALNDEYEPGDVIEFLSSNGSPLCYFVNPITPDSLGSTQNTFSYGTARMIPHDNMIYLGLNMGYEKLYLGDNQVKLLNELNDNRVGLLDDKVKVRTSTSLLWGNLDKLEDLLLLDKVIIHRDIANLLTPTILGINLPNSNSLTEMVEVVNKMEQLVNGNNVRVRDVIDGKVSIEDISKVKIIPVAGDKGTPQHIDTARNENKIEFTDFKDQLELFLLSIGIPPDLFLGASDNDVTRIYIRYSKLIKRISYVIIDFLKKILVGHFNAKYPKFVYKPSHFNITIRTNSNLDTLEFTEAQELHLASARSFVATLEDLNPLIEQSKYSINADLLIEKLDSMLSEVGSPFTGIFSLKEATSDTVEEEIFT